MVRIRRCAALIAGAFSFFAASPVLAVNQDVTLHNHTVHIIKSLAVSPTGENRWSEDILGQDILDDHTDLIVKFPREDGTCKWDVRVEFRNGTTAQVRNVDLCSGSDVFITP